MNRRIFKTILLLGALLFFVTPDASAQLNLKKIKSKLNKSKSNVKKVELNYSEEAFPPTIEMHSLLERTRCYPNGALRLDAYNAVFLPEHDVNGNKVNYNFVSDYRRIFLKVYLNEELVTTMPFYAKRLGNKRYRILQRNISPSAPSNNIKCEEGKYRLDFYLDDKKFYEFEFEAYSKKSDDPYSDIKDFWFIKGPWEKVGYIEHGNYNSVFRFYIVNDDITLNPDNPRKDTKKFSWKTELYKDGKLIGETADKGLKRPNLIVHRGKWEAGSTIYLSEEEGIEYYNAKQQQKIYKFKDGKYLIKIQVDGEDKPREFEYTVKDGKIIYIPQQDRSVHTDPYTIIEGGRARYYLNKK